ncbi:ABC transporter ATP-binding protein [Lentzea sp. NPDC058450]|uniref:ATP-binding cassette domain-containing protein n=1 Tax=Lentzea sp. NPDC058450 TaxID=3346505 RepID=UPI00365E8811
MAKRTFGNGLTARLLFWSFKMLGIIIWQTLVLLAKVSWWTGKKIVQHPRSSVTASLLGSAVYLVGWEILAGLVGLMVLGSSTWMAADRETFDRFLGDWLAAWGRRWWSYRRTWDRVMVHCGLAVDVDDERYIPALRKIKHSRYWDRLVVEMPVGQEVADIRMAAERVRHAFEALRITVTEIEPAGVELGLMRRDPFKHEVVPAADMPAATADIDWKALPVGLTEYCAPWTISLTGGHTAVCGTSGAGKASIGWNLLRAIAPAIADGTALLHFIDPKRMELRQARRLVATHVPIDEVLDDRRRYVRHVRDERSSYVCGPEETLAMLRGLVEAMQAAAELAGERGERDHEPSTSTPLNVIVIDELAPLLEYWPRTIRDKIMELLGLLLTQGRALGYLVVGEIQEPTKDVFKIRDLFQRRIALRLPTEAHTDAALTEHAVDRGAKCHEIPESLPGVAYELLQGATAATRNRAGHVTDEDIAALVEYVDQLRLAAEVAAVDARTEDKAVAA